METLVQDIRYALRTLSRSPGLVLVAVISLGLGIGVNTTVFSCVNALFLRPYPYVEQERLVTLWEAQPRRGIDENSISYANFVDWRAETRSFTGMAANYGQSFNLAGPEQNERVEGRVVSWNTFLVLGVTPMLGRDFREDEENPGGPRVAILSALLWERLFRSDSGAIGRSIILNGQPHTVVGVLPEPHHFPADAQLWLPITLNPAEERGSHFQEAIGRLRPGVSLAQAEADLGRTAGRLAQQYPESNTGWTVRVVPMREAEVGEYRSVLAIMMAAVAFVLLIACANVANLLLARATGRSREIAVRTALGGGRLRIARQVLTESVILALGGAALGILIALWGLDFIVAAVPQDKPFWMVFTIDWRVLAFTIAVAVGTGLLFGLAPAVQAAKTDLHESLKEGTRGAGTGASRHRLRSTLVVVEVALSTVLLIGAALMIRSFLAIQRVEPGFDRQNLLTFAVYLAGPRYDSTAQREVFYDELFGRLGSLPGVVSLGMSQSPPLFGDRTTSNFVVEGQPVERGGQPYAAWQVVSAGFATHLGIPLLEGRELTEQDLHDHAMVALINRTMAQRFWPGQSALGKRFQFGVGGSNAWQTVVGVVEDVRHQRVTDGPENQVYRPYTQRSNRGMVLQLRTVGNPAVAAPAVRETVAAMDPTLPVYALATMDEVYRRSMWEQRLYSGMFGGFAAAALLLATLGLYGVMAYTVSLRLHEIGVRMALGAGRQQVLALVVGRGLSLTAVGLAVGLAGAFGLTRVLERLLFGVSAMDPLSFGGIPLVLAAVAVLASYVPARRATAVDPVAVLRSE